MAKFAVQGSAAEAITNAAGLKAEDLAGATKMAVALSSGVIAGVAAAVHVTLAVFKIRTTQFHCLYL